MSSVLFGWRVVGGGSVSRVVREMSLLSAAENTIAGTSTVLYSILYNFTVQLLYSGTGGIYPLHRNDTVVEGVGDVQSSI